MSIVDFVVELERDTTTEELHNAFREAEAGPMKGILGFSEEPLVSMDYKQDPRSSIIDAQFTSVIAKNMAKVVAWYDNEWGYSVRTADLAMKIAESL